VIDLRRTQRLFGDGFVQETVDQLWEDWGKAAQEKVKTIYRKLVEVTTRVVGQAKKFSAEIGEDIKQAADALQQATLQGLRHQLDAFIALVQQVIRQTKARVFGGNTRAEGKLVSLFEPDTEIIRKGKASKPTEFGKMVKLQEAENQIIIAYEVYDQRPNDKDLSVPAVQIHEQRLDRAPELVAGDAGFYSAQGTKVPKRTTAVAPPKAINICGGY
jgi:IS5 family transposase